MKQQQQHGPRSTFRVTYTMEGGKMEGTETLLRVLGLLIEDHGAGEFIAACERMKWKSTRSFDEVKADGEINWLQVTSDYWIRIYLENKHKKEHLDRLAAELGILGQLRCEVVPDGLS